MDKIVKTSLITVGLTAAALTAILVYLNQDDSSGERQEIRGGASSSGSDEYTSSSNSHELSSDTSEEGMNCSSSSSSKGTVSSPRNIHDYLRMLRYDDFSDSYINKKLEAAQVLLSISAYSESFPMLEELDVISNILENMNYILSLDVTSPVQDVLLIKLGLFLGNLLASKNSQLRVIDNRFVPTLCNLINDKNFERSDFSLLCLQNLSLNEEGGVEIIISHGIDSFIRLLESSKPINLKKQALHTILNMSLNRKVKVMIDNNEGLLRALSHYATSGSNQDLVNITTRTLSLLTSNEE
ncbi:hypothetical protein DFA_10618 [Cavenderia fasciculata]|uniref:Armadillo repeat-containing domain-containing protein n=1 Tax=Cavenderia fasciculata TaxID=261658 RepID=F4QAQ6_CACFS|nr:uncharacterized protein DFA_10618 [Cavenderia fasciculata]EGG15775.1 hypothetical protein DFA_10618 [Cavenderia fasciculata]|eukprot:XP_004354522.1 hypothetical protein DFA_10618 [Cavenderia fasciculata]